MMEAWIGCISGDAAQKPAALCVSHWQPEAAVAVVLWLSQPFHQSPHVCVVQQMPVIVMMA